MQIQNGKDPTYVKISSKLSKLIRETFLKPIYARWIADWYNHVIKEKEMIVRGFDSAGILEVVDNVDNIYVKIENSLRK